MTECRTLNRSDDGAVLVLDTDDVIELALTENPTTGYRWEFEDLSDVVEVIDDRFDAATQLVPGRAGTRTWRLRAARAGTGRLALRYVQPWEGDSSTADRCTFTIEVDG